MESIKTKAQNKETRLKTLVNNMIRTSKFQKGFQHSLIMYNILLVIGKNKYRINLI